MAGGISMYVLLVCVWCSLDVGGFLMVVTAQPTVSAVILTPEADRKEGGQVDMRCTARNLELDHIVEWRTENPGRTLRWGEATVYTNSRFIFDTSTDLVTQTVVQDFAINNMQRTDTDEYVCNVNDPKPNGGYDVLATSSVTLSVLYFPSESFPMCSPDAGPITVDAGTELDMTCSSESSYGTVTLTINPTVLTSRYTTWTSEINQDTDTVVRTLALAVDDAHNGVAFECAITSMYFTDVQRRCLIGPITVKNTKPTSSSDPPSPATPWILVAIVTTVFAIEFFVVIILMIRVKGCRAKKESQVNEPDLYEELQLTEDNNLVYTEPATADDTYYQSVEVENETPEYDYAPPDDHKEQQRKDPRVSFHQEPRPTSTTTDIEQYSQADQTEKESTELDYLQPDDHKEQQRKDPRVSVHQEPKPTSETTDIEHYFQPDQAENESQEPDYVQPNDYNEQQRMDHRVSVPLEPKPTSETTDIEHTYFQPDKAENESQEPDYVQPNDYNEQQRMDHRVSVPLEPNRLQRQLT